MSDRYNEAYYDLIRRASNVSVTTGSDNSNNSSAAAYGSSAAGARCLPHRTLRYGRRPSARASIRDDDFWSGFRPHTTPRQRLLRECRRRREEEETRSLVSKRGPLAKNVLTVKSVDLHTPENTKEHRTSDYDCTERKNNPCLVVRRAQEFIMTLTFQRPWSSRDDNILLEFSVGDEPNEANGSVEKVQLNEPGSSWYMQEGRWGAKIAKQEGPILTIYVYIAPDAIVGEWECQVTTSLENSADKEVFTFTSVPDIFVLFNPWCPEDQVHYTEKPGELDEYVLNEYGCSFYGAPGSIRRAPWFYGQFQDGILDVCMTILRMAFDMEVTKEMGDAVVVSRKLSRIINHAVITGNWTGKYAGGTEPTSWKGSVQILKQYARTKTAVKYGQCWVFANVLTTVCRALGLPCRSLTNFESAHDTDKTVTIDSYKDENGEDLPGLKSDSIWNFHCWNDVWINRPDLDSTSSARGRYSGWHALDATPQERSEGRFQCGPSPHLAIKSGELSIGNDTGFIFAEVNGEVCTWMVPRGGTRDNLKLLSNDPNAVGKSISTKVPDGEPARGGGAGDVHEYRMDITHLYKYPEGTEEERSAVQRAVGRGLGAKIFKTPGGIDIDVREPDGVMVGNDFTFTAVFSNSSIYGRLLNITMGVFPIDYRGERLGLDNVAYSRQEGVILKPGQSQSSGLLVPEKSYIRFCDKSMSMVLRASAKVEGQDRPVTKSVKIVMVVPDLQVQLREPKRIRRGHPFTLVVVVSNPLNRPLAGCRLQMTGPVVPLAFQGFSEGDGSYVKKIKDISPRKTTSLDIKLQANKRPLLNNNREVDISVISYQLPDMTGSLSFKLQP